MKVVADVIMDEAGELAVMIPLFPWYQENGFSQDSYTINIHAKMGDPFAYLVDVGEHSHIFSPEQMSKFSFEVLGEL